jgi:ABC-type Fe3+/spermidine/putrescine transport system ATPase subunit
LTAMLTLERLTKSYGSNRVVDGLNLALQAGEFVSLLGPSGCGKTTTLRMVAGFVKPSAGRIVADGNELSSAGSAVAPEKRGMSMIFQSYALWPNMTVAQNVAFGLKMRGVAAAERRQRVGRMLEVVQLGHLASRYPNELSGGQQQRVSLARAIVVRPSVLLLDEPLSNLDANLREEMRSEIRRLHDEFGTTSIYVTHDQAEAMVTSDRIAVMNGGRIEQVDEPQRLYARPATRFVASSLASRTSCVAYRTACPSRSRGSMSPRRGSAHRLEKGRGGFPCGQGTPVSRRVLPAQEASPFRAISPAAAFLAIRGSTPFSIGAVPPSGSLLLRKKPMQWTRVSG